MTSIRLAELAADISMDQRLYDTHLDDKATGCCVICQRPAPCDTRLDAGNRLSNRLLRMTRS